MSVRNCNYGSLKSPWLIQEPDLFRELRPPVSVERFTRLIISGQRPRSPNINSSIKPLWLR